MNAKVSKKFFWLHIKKCGGTTIKNFLGDIYDDIPNQSNIPSFIQVDKKYWNAILNNSRCNLGDFVNKRSLFAKTYLYQDEWSNIHSFAFIREPIDRCLSMFNYLILKNQTDYLKLIIKIFFKRKKIVITKSNIFDWFLDILEIIHCNEQKEILEFKYKTNHFIMHTNPYYNDLTDINGNILIKKIYKIETFDEDIKDLLNQIEISPNYENLISQIDLKIMKEQENNNYNKMKILINRKNYLKKYAAGQIHNLKLNSNNKKKLILSSKHLKKIKKIYNKDFDLYERL